MNIKYIFTLAVIILASAMSQAQNNLPKTTIGGHQFYYYETGANESIYDIAAKLGVTKDYIIQNNPNAADGIESGMTLYFPVNEAEEAVSAAISHAPSAQIHIVEQGQTLYGLAKKYSITVEDLIAANPGSENGIQIGQKLNIPSASKSSIADTDQQVRNAFGRNTEATRALNLTNTLPERLSRYHPTLPCRSSMNAPDAAIISMKSSEARPLHQLRPPMGLLNKSSKPPIPT